MDILKLAIITATYLILGLSTISGQQTPQYTMKMYNIYQSNVAFAGIEDNLNIFSYYRTQWQSVEGQPKQYMVNATIPMHIWKGGVGAKLEGFNNGAERITRAAISYNRIFNTGLLTISGGASIGLSQISIDGSKLITPEGQYIGIIDHQDPILENQVLNSIYPEYMLSGFVSHPLFDIGFSMNNVIPSTRNLEAINFTQSKYFELLGIYYIPLRGGYLLEPGITIRTNLNVVQTDIFTSIKYGNIFGGIQLRGYSGNSLESFSLMGGIKFNDRYTISYSFDVLVNALRQVSDGTHELMLKYSFQNEINTGLPPRTMYSPRNL